MEVTYLSHSGFLLETEETSFLFDYYKGGLPQINTEKNLVVFVSHWHPDHYNPEIFELTKSHPQVRYVLSKDVATRRHIISYKMQGIDLESRITVAPKNKELDVVLENGKELHITTFKSTDVGVAFLIRYDGHNIFHAGDLNIWAWEEETKEYNNNMRANFEKEMKKLEGTYIDIAFFPLDPRQRRYAEEGLSMYLRYTVNKRVFPMHFWRKYSLIREFKKNHPEYDEQIQEITKKNEKFYFDAW